MKCLNILNRNLKVKHITKVLTILKNTKMKTPPTPFNIKRRYTHFPMKCLFLRFIDDYFRIINSNVSVITFKSCNNR